MVEPSQTQNLYLRLGVSADATTEQIKQAYKQLALKHHPDRNPENPDLAHENFVAISEAFEVLSDPLKRMQYNSSSRIISHRGKRDFNDMDSFFADDFSFYDYLFRHPEETMRRVVNIVITETGYSITANTIFPGGVQVKDLGLEELIRKMKEDLGRR